MTSFFEMYHLLESFEVIQEAGSTQIDNITNNRFLSSIPPEMMKIKPFVKRIIDKGWRGGMHSVDELEAPGDNPDLIVQALMYLQSKGAVKFVDDDHFQVSDMNQFGGAGGSSLKGAQVGAISRRMAQAGSDSQKTRGSWQEKLKQVYGAYPQFQQEFNALFKGAGWKSMMAGHKIRAEEFLQNAPDPEKFFTALTVLRHEEIIGFYGDKANADSTLTARQFKDAVHGDIDELLKKYPHFAKEIQQIMGSGGWRRMMAGKPVEAGSLLGVGKTGGDFSPNVERLLMALGVLRAETLIAFEGKPSLTKIVSKANAETDVRYKGASDATPEEMASADRDARLWHANKMHGGTAQQKQAPGAMASVGDNLSADDTPEGLAQKWWGAWRTASQAIDRDPDLIHNDKFMKPLHDNTMKVIQHMGRQIQSAIQANKPQEEVKPLILNLLKVAKPHNADIKPVDVFDDIEQYVMKVTQLYRSTYGKRRG